MKLGALRYQLVANHLSETLSNSHPLSAIRVRLLEPASRVRKGARVWEALLTGQPSIDVGRAAPVHPAGVPRKDGVLALGTG